MNALFPKLPANPTKAGFREMQIYELVRQAADAWNIPLEQVAKFQEWWDGGRTDELARTIVLEYLSPPPVQEQFGHRFSQYYHQHTSYALSEQETTPNVSNLIDIAEYYLTNTTITVPHFVINIASQNLYDIAELGESVLVLTGEKNYEEIRETVVKKKKHHKSFLLEYLRKVQLLVEEFQIISTKSLPDLYISNSITFKFSVNMPVKCRNLILAKKVKIEGVRFMPHQMQVMGGL